MTVNEVERVKNKNKFLISNFLQKEGQKTQAKASSNLSSFESSTGANVPPNTASAVLASSEANNQNSY